MAFTKRAQSSSGNQGFEDIVSTAAGQQHAGFTFPTSTPWVMVAAVFKAAGGATVPGAPTNASATAGNAQATVNWTAPSSNGGSAITYYTVTSSPGGFTAQTANGTTTNATVTGLSNGTSYTFTVTATNAVGTGPASSTSNAVTPSSGPTAPGAPTGASATAGNANASVSWTAPGSNGGSSITYYTVTSSPGGFTAQTANGTTTSATVTGLTNGTSYTFTVTATNLVGTGPASSPSNAVTPATVPGAPTGASATAGNAQATVSWTAPSSNGGSAITYYKVTSSPGGFTAQTANGSTTTATVTGLSNGTSYTFTVTATNAVGTGAASSSSNPVTPAASSSITFVQGQTFATGGRFTSQTVTFGAVAAGDLLVGEFGQYDSSGQVSVSDNVNGAWTRSVSTTWNGSAGDIALYYFANSAAAPSGLTITITATNATYLQGSPAEYSGVATVNPLDQGVVAKGSSTSADSGLTPATGAGELVYGGMTATNGAGTLTPGSSQGVTFTKRAQTSSGTQGLEDIVSSVAGQQHAGFSFPTSGPWFMVAGVFKAASGATVPGAPTNASATAGNAQATVSWTAASSNGGSAITYYIVTSSPGGFTAQTANGSTTTATVTGLSNGTSYTFTVTATNAIGTGLASAASNAVTPATVPSAPLSVNASGGMGQAAVSWLAPASNGGSSITSYTVTSSPGGIQASVGGNTLSATVTGLTNGTSYTFTVTATNSAGTGPASAPSNAVTTGVTIRTYYYANRARIATAVNGVFSYLASDGLGSADVTLDTNGNLTAAALYAPYGSARYAIGIASTDYGFTGQHSDTSTGLDYYGARYYDPVAGQFTSADTILPGGGYDIWGLSRYAYVEGNPIGRTDPTGQIQVCDCGDAAGNTGNPLPPTAPRKTLIDPSSLQGRAINWAASQLENQIGSYVDSAKVITKFTLDAVGGWAGWEQDALSSGDPLQVTLGVLGVTSMFVGGPEIAAGKDLLVAGGERALPEALTVGRNAETGVDVYVGVRGVEASYAGITNNLLRRAAQHGSRFDRLDQLTTRSVTRGEARAIEQAMIVRNPEWENVANSISPSHGWYQQAVDWGERWLQGNGY